MRFTVTVPDSIDAQIRALSDKERQSKSEWVNLAISEKIERSAPDYTPPRFRDFADLTAERDQLKAEAARARDLLSAARDEINFLRGEVSKMTDRIPALPEKAGPGRPWWRFW